MRLLTLLIEADGGSLRREELFAGIWPNQLVADQTLDSAVSRLRSKLGDDPKAPRFIQTMPKRGYRLLLPAIPCLDGPAAMESATFGMEPSDVGERARTDSAISSVANGRRVRRSVVVLAALGVLGLVIVAATAMYPRGGSADINASGAAGISRGDLPMSSVAVLPFTNMSDDADTTYFSDGIAEELLNQLTRVSGLQVASRTSSFRFRERAETVLPDIREIGRELGVRFIVEGSVRRIEDDLRVTVQLIDAQDGFHRWSHTYEKRWDNVFDLQLRMTQDIVKQIAPQLAPDPASSAALGNGSPRAFELYLLGRHYWHQRQPGSLRQALAYFEQSAQADPYFALAYTGMADTHLLMVDYADVSLERAVEKAEPVLAKALKLAPDLAESRLALGHLHSLRGEWRQAEHELKRSLALNENLAASHMLLGNVFNRSGRLDFAYFSYLQALRLDPLHATTLMNLSQAALKLGLYDEAGQHLKRARELFPGHAYLFGLRVHLTISAGDIESAKVLTEECARQPLAQAASSVALNDTIACGMLGLFLERPAFAQDRLEAALTPDARRALQGEALLLALNHLASALASLGKAEQARATAMQAQQLASELTRRFDQSEVYAYELAVAEHNLGHRQPAADALLRSLELGRRDLGWIQNDRRIADLIKHPGLREALQRIALAQLEMRHSVQRAASGSD